MNAPKFFFFGINILLYFLNLDIIFNFDILAESVSSNPISLQTRSLRELSVIISSPAKQQIYSPLEFLKAKLKEFTVTSENILEVGTEIIPSHFVVGQYVDVEGTSIGKGFAGAMKRHNFAGLGASHGVSIYHRSHGSTGNSQDPGKVWKGKKMAGQMGNVRVTLNNLQIMSTDDDRGLILIKGGVPGPKGSWVFIKDSKKKALPPGVPYPAGIRSSVADKQNGIENTLSDTNDSLGQENLKGKEGLKPIEELSEKTSDLSKGTEKESPVEGDKEK